MSKTKQFEILKNLNMNLPFLNGEMMKSQKNSINQEIVTKDDHKSGYQIN